jgi:hypothetical protein
VEEDLLKHTAAAITKDERLIIGSHRNPLLCVTIKPTSLFFAHSSFACSPSTPVGLSNQIRIPIKISTDFDLDHVLTQTECRTRPETQKGWTLGNASDTKDVCPDHREYKPTKRKILWSECVSVVHRQPTLRLVGRVVDGVKLVLGGDCLGPAQSTPRPYYRVPSWDFIWM